MSGVRVAILTNIPTPYRMPLYRRLAGSSQHHYHVFFLAQTERNRRWQPPPHDEPWATYLNGWTFDVGRKDTLSVHINPDAVEAISEFDPDVIVLGGYSSLAHLAAASYAIRKNVPYLLWSGSTLREAGWLRRALMPVIRFLVTRAAGFISYGSDATDYLVSCGADRAKVVESYNTVDTEFIAESVRAFAPERHAIRAEFGIAPDVPVLLYLGQLIERKGVLNLVRGFAHVAETRPFHLVMAGDGPLASVIRKELRRSRTRDRVSLPGHVDASGMVRLLAEADAVILPSHQEVWGLTINEAMAGRCLALASVQCGCTRDLVSSATGVSFEPTLGGICTALRRWLDLSEEAKATMVENAQRLVLEKVNLTNAAAGFELAISMHASRGVRALD